MTKADIVSEIAKSTGIEKVQVRRLLEAFMERERFLIQGNDDFSFRGFGSFIVKARPEGSPATFSKGTTITIPEHNIPRIQACEELRCEG